MADDPMTLTFVKQRNRGPGDLEVTYLAAGPADYDATNGAAMDVSTYFQTIDNVVFGGVTAKADALIYPPTSTMISTMPTGVLCTSHGAPPKTTRRSATYPTRKT